MIIQSIEVRGQLALSLTFSKVNIVLGENKTGKTTLLKLLLYALGTKIESFIDEISKDMLCKQVEVVITTKNEKRYKVIRSLPFSETVIVIPIVDSSLVEDEMEALSIAEYSDFLLHEEGYANHTIAYGKDKKATLRYYNLLRAVIADQDTSAYKILADLGGTGMDYVNSQGLVKKAIIETILGDDDQRVHKTRLELQALLSQIKALSSKEAVVTEMIKKDIELDKDLTTDVAQLSVKLQDVISEKNAVSTSEIKDMQNFEAENNDLYENQIKELKLAEVQQAQTIRKLTVESTDVKNVIDRLKTEIEQLKRMIIARQVITKIPVEHCPVCLSSITLPTHTEAKCPFCNNTIDPREIERIAKYKSQLEESLIEAIQVRGAVLKELKDVQREKNEVVSRIESIKVEYFQQVNRENNPINSLVNSLAIKLDAYAKKEEQLRNFINKVEYRNSIKSMKYKIGAAEQELRDNLGELEQENVSSKETKLSAWRKIFVAVLGKIFKDIDQADIDNNYQPYVDNTEVRLISSASLKVATRLAYILSLFKLQDLEQVNHVGFCFFDSPKDKDLDADKYQRFLGEIGTNKTGQVFLTGSVKEVALYQDEKIPVMLTLSDQKKLLTPTDKMA